ncbi:MAG: FadR family transcriptional regulator [Epulopiscium sp.]|nr:FadR family transcriptional regulator [Candidatus Epulonipiscium sp.]
MIKEMIVSQELMPGDKLPSEAELCEILGISRSTVREAIKILIAENIVEIKRGKGTFVTRQPGMVQDPLGVNFMAKKNMLFNLFETRLIIEPNIAYLAAQRATKENLEKLEKLMNEFHNAKAEGINYSEIDIQFHNAIAESTQNEILDRILPLINDSIIQGYKETVNIPGSFEKAVVRHERIFRAIKNKDSELAKDEMEKHLKEVIKEIL